MKSSVKLHFCRWDWLVAAGIAALAVCCTAIFWLQGAGDGALTAVVSIDGAAVERMDISAAGSVEKVYTNNGYTLHVLARDGEICVAEADCPNQDCVHTGFIDTPGQSIVCLPARISIQLVRSGNAGGVDAVIG